MTDAGSKIRKSPILVGFIGSSVLLTIYFGILTVANSFNHAVEEFTNMWYWILILVLGFGIQVGLYYYIRVAFHARRMAATTSVATTGGISTTSMIACCAHHLTDVLPIIGLSAAAVFLTKYQLVFILLGILSNLIGITIMLEIIQKHELFDGMKGLFGEIFRFDMKGIRNKTIILSILIFSMVLIVTISGCLLSNTRQQTISLPTKTNTENGVSFEVTPVDFSYNKPVIFEVRIDTHWGSLDFDLKDISVLEDSWENEYKAIDWKGSPPGGHHRFGLLKFPKLKGQSKYMKLTIKNVYNVPERVFIWNLE
ncbi:MAG: hypothetical protein ACE5K4_11480 [Candidatus Hydrothermarchaeota archaeon]